MVLFCEPRDTRWSMRWQFLGSGGGCLTRERKCDAGCQNTTSQAEAKQMYFWHNGENSSACTRDNGGQKVAKEQRVRYEIKRAVLCIKIGITDWMWLVEFSNWTCFETRQFLQMDRALEKTRVLVGRVQSSPFFLLVESFSPFPSVVLFIYSTSFLRLPRITISKIATLEPLRRRTIDKRSVSNLFGIHLPSPGPTFISPL
jgi:hypothetical protein